MSSKFKKRPSFTKEKAEILKRTLAQFDEEISDDSLTLEESLDTSSIKDRTFLLHVLIEALCYSLEKDENRRKKLFNSLYKSLVANKLVDSVINVDNLARMRRHAALRFYEHIKQVHQSISPLSNELNYEEQESSIPISRIEKYNDAFDELEVVAHGGFGTVCKARHKVDGGTYAVKKIIFEYRKDSDYIKVMREVRNLSSLSNKYVVAYNNAWVQPVDEPCDLNFDTLDSESDYTEGQSTDNRAINKPSIDYSNASFVEHSYNARRVSSYSESSSIVFQSESNNSQSNLNTSRSQSFSSIVFQNNPNDSESSLNTSQSKSFLSGYSLKNEESRSKLPNFPILRIKMMLCIQMEFCDYDLRHWLDARNEGRTLPFSKSVPDIFKEILCGVAYIHEKDIIHRDLKPQNIFFSEAKGVMKVGDFGLATLSHTPSDEEQGSSNHSTNLGTLPYAAPEQRSNSIYDSKVDMYSLGIILIELLVKIGTKMEFNEVIENFKKEKIPEEVEQTWPEYVPLLKNLLHENHTVRPDAKQVLDMPLFKDKKIEVLRFEFLLCSLESNALVSPYLSNYEACFLTRNLSAADIHRQICEVYGATAMCEGKVRKWVRDFKAGRNSIHDDSRSGHPSVITDDMVALVEAKILEQTLHHKHSFKRLS
ncbi:Eukaryotic translation initiation factor 2-alpha kinase 1 [Araneus ventricosus]|uniref:Eukaryotic translation initiation factor 2-alpha kinase 1 n=1 Tax=Araneus ventricosus TaxID=182803 RepID=A0A4Y2BXS4_ARAVE|nr:Eukaryotic translation initiation factor 2-alpha kinase 1 [Araneus ventricosus]